MKRSYRPQMPKVKSSKVMTITSVMAFDMEKPRFNGFAAGHGAHKNEKVYTRKQKHRGSMSD